MVMVCCAMAKFLEIEPLPLGTRYKWEKLVELPQNNGYFKIFHKKPLFFGQSGKS